MKKIFYVILILSILFKINIVHANNMKFKAKILKVNEYRKDIIEYGSNTSIINIQNLTLKIISDGKYKNLEYDVDYKLGEAGTVLNNNLHENQVVYIEITNNNEKEEIHILDVDKSPYLIGLFLMFCILVLVIGKLQGLKTLVSLAVTLISIIYIFLPMIMNGYSAILSAIFVCIIISTVSLILVCGINKKAFTTIISTIIGVLFAGLLCNIVSYLGDITGLINDESQMLIYLTEGKQIDIKGIFFASVLIGAIGATMDMSMSITSAMFELVTKAKGISKSELIKSGLAVGKDSMSTMSSTLILAYVGESLSLILLMMYGSSNLQLMLNSDYIASEITRSLCGTIGMITSIPITTWIYANIYNRNFKINKN